PGRRGELLDARALRTRSGSGPSDPPRATHPACPGCGATAPPAAAEDSTGARTCPACGLAYRVDPALADPWPPGGRARLGKYEVFEEVGRGAFGVVYRARDTELDRVVAVKVPRRGFVLAADGGRANGKKEGGRDRFLHEARSAAQLRHP